MTSGDDDALSWEGDDDPTLDARADRAARSAPDVPRATAEPAAAAAPKATPSDEAPSLGSAALVAYGVLGGVFALYMVGWALGGFRLRDRVQADTGAVADVMLQGAMWLGMLAPAIWFVAAVVLTRGGPQWRRFAALAVGVLVLVPWPFVMMGAMGR
ncbi:DNA polymerase III subunit gamma/tau [Microbacterium lacusdiani]